MRKASVFRLALLAGAALSLCSTAAVADGPFQFYSVTPCRIVDTRVTPNGVTAGPALAHGAVRNFPIRNPAASCGVLATAKAAVLNVTVVSPSGTGHLTIFPYDPPPVVVPLISTINFSVGEAALANGAIVPLTEDASFHVSVSPSIASGTGNVHLLIDVTGYFAP